jgi:hypothetical protein
MKNLLMFLIIVGFATAVCGREGIWLTIYDQNYAVVRDVRAFELTKGVSEVKFTNISRMILDAPVRTRCDGAIVREQTFQYYRITNDLLLRENLGKAVTFLLRGGDTLLGTIVGQPASTRDTTDKFLIQAADGSVRSLRLADVLDYRYAELPPEYCIKPTLTFVVESAEAGMHDIEAAYEVQGLDWDAHYLLDLSKSDSQAVFSGWAIVKNGAGLPFENAHLTLVSGQPPRSNRRLRVSTDERMSETRISGLVSREARVKRDVSSSSAGFSAQAEAIAYAAPEHEQLFDLQVYTLPYMTTLPDGAEKDVNLFPPATIKTTTRYEYAYWQNPSKVGAYVMTMNTDSAGLGTPLPAGWVEIYRFRAGNVPEYVGEDRLAAVAQNGRLRIRVGYAEGLSGERKLLKTETHLSSKIDEQWEIRIHNARDTDVSVSVQDFCQGKWKILNSSHPYNMINDNYFEFPVIVPAEGDTVITYEIRKWQTWKSNPR